MKEEPLCTYFLDSTVDETELCTFLTIQTFVSGKLCFLCITLSSTHFDHLASSEHRAFNNTKNMVFGMCLAFLMGIQTEVECCMTQNQGSTTVLEAEQCTFMTLAMETYLFKDSA